MNREARQRFQALAKQLSFILCHAPDEFGLVLEPGGWIPLRTLVQALHEEDAWKGITVSRIIDLGWQLEDCPLNLKVNGFVSNPVLLVNRCHPSANRHLLL
ncbi:MAG: RNA 2'-phosphotransferase [Candidatus Omnitrophica bacterium]|nr:RNA 2'-phosphotransferase [Candidatus Omnitrophota bacterium]